MIWLLENRLRTSAKPNLEFSRKWCTTRRLVGCRQAIARKVIV